jgi:hypothetical protein
MNEPISGRAEQPGVDVVRHSIQLGAERAARSDSPRLPPEHRECDKHHREDHQAPSRHGLSGGERSRRA